VGVVGDPDCPRATLFALALRDYGRHSVVGWRLPEPPRRDRDAAQSWDRLPIPQPTSLAWLVGNCEVVYACATELSQIADWCSVHPDPPLVVSANGASRRWVVEQCGGRTPRLAVHCHPLQERLEALASPMRFTFEVLTGGGEVEDRLRALWTPVINTVPILFSQAPNRLSEDIGDGSGSHGEPPADHRRHLDTPQPEEANGMAQEQQEREPYAYARLLVDLDDGQQIETEPERLEIPDGLTADKAIEQGAEAILKLLTNSLRQNAAMSFGRVVEEDGHIGGWAVVPAARITRLSFEPAPAAPADGGDDLDRPLVRQVDIVG
jgi:hypothetical protein